MRFTELALFTVTLLGAVRPLTGLRRSTALAAAAAAATSVAAVVHALGEGPRWQLVPLYLAAVATAALATLDARGPREPLGRRTPIVVALVLTGAGAALGWALPVAQLPEPGGPHEVGTTQLVVVDEDRREHYGPRPGGHRRLAVQLWYPASPDDGAARAPWTTQPGAFARHTAERFDVPAFTLSHLRLVRSHAVADAPVVPGRARPLVVYSHGWSSFRGAQSGLMESLASRGFVVAAVDHTHASLASVFPDGTVLGHDPRTLPDQAGTEEYEAASRRLVETFAGDLEAVVGHLRAVRPLGGAVDTGNLGLIGHSTGGGAAILACGRLRSCNAVVGFDPWVEPLRDEAVGGGLEQPLLSVRSEEWVATDNDARLRRLHAASGPHSGRVAFEGTLHRDFTLAPFVSPLAARPLDDAMPPRELHGLVEEWTVGFLRHHLAGARLDPLDEPFEHPRMTVER